MKDHWRPMCKSTKESKPKKPDKQKQKPKKVHALAEDCDEDNLYFEALHIGSTTSDSQTEIVTMLKVQSRQKIKRIRCKLDTGAQGNAMPLEIYKLLHPKSRCDEFGVPIDLPKPSTRITAYGGNEVVTYGTCKLKLHAKGEVVMETFHVVKASDPVIIGYPTCKSMNLVTVNCSLNLKHLPANDNATSGNSSNDQANNLILKDYGDCFDGIGCFQGSYHITLDPEVPPVVHPPRRIPEALREPLKKELRKLVDEGIIAKVDIPTDWVNSIVCATKPRGGIRLCLDPRDLNRAIKRPHHVTPTLDDILPKLNGAKYFTILDARSGYWNIKLDEESSYATTFNTPIGRFRFLRLPFGLVCAQDVFQKKVDETFGELPGVTGIADDIVIVGYKEDGSDHDANLKRVLDTARSAGIRFNPEKMVVKCTAIPFFGNILTANGLKPDPAKIAAIEAMEQPEDLKQLQTFLGMANYLCRFTPNLSAIAAPLRDLCKKSSEFIWGPEHSKAFMELKRVIASPTVLRYYNSKEPLTIQVDASIRGLGAALLQPDGPVAFASKALTETEQRYSNIERELLGIVFGLERFHYYAYGRKVTGETDHKPLVSIHSKALANAPPRLARMLLRIQKYDLDIKYVPGKEIGLADALSRVKPCPGQTIKGLDISIHELHMHLNCSATRIEDIKRKTLSDSVLMALKEYIFSGWPEKRSLCPSHLHPYWNYRDELHCVDGLILKCDRIVVPKVLQEEALKQLHYAHQGSEKCKLRAKGSVFWAGINSDIEDMIAKCSTCQKHRNSNCKETLIPHDIPPHAWHTLGSDLFTWNKHCYLLLVDYYSKFPIIRKLTSITSAAIILQMKGIFDEHGIPEKLVTDGGTQYSSKEFKSFSECYGFTHEMSSPHYARSNGMSERCVQTVKNILQKSLETGSDPHLAMICYRATPLDHNIPSPSQLLNGRQYKTNLPSYSRQSDGDVNSELQKRQEKQTIMHDKHAKYRKDFTVGEAVRIQHPDTKTWEPANIIEKSHTPRSYTVKTGLGSVYRRNSFHINKTKESFKNNDMAINRGTQEDPTAADDVPPVTPPVKVSTPVKSSPLKSVQPTRRSERTIKKPDILDL